MRRKRLFVKSSGYVLSDLAKDNAIPSDLSKKSIQCFDIEGREFYNDKGKVYFYFDIYQNLKDYDDIRHKSIARPYMRIYISGLQFKDSSSHYQKDSCSYYIKIPKFRAGTYWVDISTKINPFISVPCDECIENHENHYKPGAFIKVTNITPDKWKLKR